MAQTTIDDPLEAVTPQRLGIGVKHPRVTGWWKWFLTPPARSGQPYWIPDARRGTGGRHRASRAARG